MKSMKKQKKATEIERFSTPKLQKQNILRSDRIKSSNSPFFESTNPSMKGINNLDYKTEKKQTNFSPYKSYERTSKITKLLRGMNRYNGTSKTQKDQQKEQSTLVKLPQIKNMQKQNHNSNKSGNTEKFFIKEQKEVDFMNQIEDIIPTTKRPMKAIKKSDYTEFQVAHRTKAGTNGRNMKVNQDIEIIEQKLPFGIKLFCVCDGHGVNGHHVAAFIKKKMIENLKKNLKNLTDQQYLQTELYIAFQRTNDELLNCDINTELSGSTVIAVFIYQDKIVSFNVGDSRAILINSEYSKWTHEPISIDQKPSREDQAKRILANGGRIDNQVNERGEKVGPLRVWMRNIRSPGLAMTRSFGDKAGIKAGTSGQPEILEYTLQSKNKYLLIASDGLWQHLENSEIVQILSKKLSQNKMEQAADELLLATLQEWNQKCFSRDDITFVLVNLQENRKGYN